MMDPWYVPDTRGLWKGTMWKDDNYVVYGSHVIPLGKAGTQLHQSPEVEPDGYEKAVRRWSDKMTPLPQVEFPAWSAATHCDNVRPAHDAEIFVVDETFGWPCLSLRYRLLYRYPFKNAAASTIELQGGMRIAAKGVISFSGLPYARALPLRPICAGFAKNTLVYAAACCVIVMTPRALRRAVHRHHNLCPSCAYPVGLGSVCTECGKPVTPKRVAPT